MMMPKKRLTIYLIIICISCGFAPVCSQADESRCVASFGKGVVETEDAVPFVKANDACKAADHMEKALNWLGTAEVECAYDSNKLREVLKLKEQLIPQLARFVSKCGH